MDEIVHEFLVESHENLDQLDRDLVALERDPSSRPLLASVFRTIHTIKGTSGFLAFGKLERLAHVGESLLSLLRDGQLELTPQLTSLLLELVDAVRGVLDAIEATGAEGDVDHSTLIERLTAAQQSAPSDRQVAEPRLGERLVEEGLVHPDDVLIAVLEQGVGDHRRIGEILVEHGAVDEATLNEVLQGRVQVRRSVADSSVRVDVDVLDNLMRLVGELLLTRNQVAGAVTSSADLGMIRAWQRLNVIATDLQDGVVKARMQPIESIWNKLPRMVRDLGQAMGKQVRLELTGGDTELDRSVLEAVKDPITHLVRNALDHGIERPDQRLAKGKPAEGRLTLTAYHEGGQVHLEIGDDGAGIDPERIAAAAVERGVFRVDEVREMSERDIVRCIFLPGLSTAEQVTNLSGRGVGMDVVKTNMERIGGSVDVQSELDVGTTFRVKIPLTLAIVAALIVETAGHRFAIPQANLLEVIRVEAEDRPTAIEYVGDAPVYRLRGDLLPLLRLRDVIGEDTEPAADRSSYILVLGGQDRQFGLVVDEIQDTEDIVVKPLSEQLKGIAEYAGATILGDGAVALILDVWAMAAEHGVGVIAHRVVEPTELIASGATEESLLVARLAGDRMLVIPLERVTRLDEVPSDRIEQVGDREALQYNGGILPIVRLATLLTGRKSRLGDMLQVVVYTENGRSVGLVVDQIVDIAEESLDVITDIDGPGVVGTTIVRDRVMEMLDVRQAILAADPHFYDFETTTAGA